CLAALKGRLPARRVSEMSEQIAAGNLAEAVGALLLEYYDPLYDRQLAALEPFDLTVSGEDPEQAACDLIAWAEKMFVYARV
ncbi:MAG TPA: hypothetical protein V6C72_13310, partial [Chroococcales cyanobacterium]